MMNAGCFSFEVNSCPEVQSVPAGSPDVRICVIVVFIAMIILIIRLIIYAEMRLSADTAANGETPEQDSCASIRCALSAVRTENLPRQP